MNILPSLNYVKGIYITKIDCKMGAMVFHQLLTHHFLAWQQSAGERRTVAEFAEWLGFAQSTVSTWWKGVTKPKDEKTIRKLAYKLGIEVYDSLGLPRPDEHLFSLEKNWEYLDEKQRRQLRNESDELAKKKKK